MILQFKKLRPKAQAPIYATEGAACFDITTVEHGRVEAYLSHVFPTGLAFEIPAGHVMLVFSRSGHGFKNGLRLSNAVGVVDSDYRGELKVKLHNDSPIPFEFDPGDRIAQAMILPIPMVHIEETDTLSETARGEGGIGSTGVK